MDTGKRTFQQYLAELGTTPAYKLATREDFAFLGTNLIPGELKGEYETFCAEWRERFGRKNTIQGIISPGWYNLTAGACKGVYDTYPERLKTCLNCWAPGRLACICTDWEGTFPGKGDEAPVVARVEVDTKFGPWIAEVSTPMVQRAWGLVHRYNGNSWWILQEYDGGFCIEIPGPGSLPFQRAAKLIECRHSSGWYNNTTLYLEWIFAAGCDNALTAADSALSGRASETISSARHKVRAAIA